MAHRFLKKIELLLISNQVEKAVELLIGFIDDWNTTGAEDSKGLRNNLIIISANLVDVNGKFNNGLISSEEYSLRKNQIIDKVLKVLQTFARDYISALEDERPRSFLAHILQKKAKEMDLLFDGDTEKYHIHQPKANQIDNQSQFYKRGGDREPYFDFSATDGVLNIFGRSIPENAVAYYRSAQVWINNYLLSMPEQTHVNIYFEYFDTSSSKILFDIFVKLSNRAQKCGKHLCINWHCQQDDDGMIDIAFDYSSLGLPIKIHEFNDLKDVKFVRED